MEGTPHLLTDVKFSERRRGYAPEEVDNFLERVSAAVAQLQDKLRDATARAEESDARINEAKRAQTVAEAQVDQLKAELQKLNEGGAAAPAATAASAPSDPAADAEAASTLLLMAKKTADATIEDARNEAATTVAEAQSRASTLVADAEAESTRVRSDAERIAADLVEEQRAVALAEVVVLEEMKGSIQADIQALQSHVDRERDDLRAAVARLSEVIDNPAALRVGDAPVGETAGFSSLAAPAAGVEAIDEVDDPAPMSDEIPDEDFADEEQADDEPAGDEQVVDEQAGDEHAGDQTSGSTPVLDDEAEFEVVEIVEAAIVESEDGDVVEVVEIDEAVLETEDGDLEVDLEEVEVIEIAEGDESVADKLFADEPDSDSGPPTQAFQPFPEEEPADGFDAPRDADEDKAMRAFFETDFESMEADKRSRWRR